MSKSSAQLCPLRPTKKYHRSIIVVIVIAPVAALFYDAPAALAFFGAIEFAQLVAIAATALVVTLVAAIIVEPAAAIGRIAGRIGA